MRNRLFLFLVLTAISCKKPSDATSLGPEASSVISVLIDEKAKPFPPPFFMFDSDTLGDGARLDSLEAVRVEVVVDTVLLKMTDSTGLEPEFAAFQPLADRLASMNKTRLDPQLIKSEEGHFLIFGDSLEDSDAEYPQVLSFSNVAFNEEKNKAVVYGGFYMGRLNGSLSLYLLEKKDGKWRIVHRRLVEIS